MERTWTLAFKDESKRDFWLEKLNEALKAWNTLPPLELVYWKPRLNLGERQAKGDVTIPVRFPKAKPRIRPGTRWQRAQSARPGGPSQTQHPMENRRLGPQNFTEAPPPPPVVEPDPVVPAHVIDAAARGKKKVIKEYIKEAGPRWHEFVDEHGDRILNIAAQLGQTALVRTLIVKHGADVNGVDENGATAAYCASRANHLQVLLILNQFDHTDFNKPDLERITPLSIACAHNATDAVKFLIGNGASVSFEDIRGITPFFTACAQGNLEAAELCLKWGVNDEGKSLVEIDKVSHRSQTALVAAAQAGYPATVKLLLE